MCWVLALSDKPSFEFHRWRRDEGGPVSGALKLPENPSIRVLDEIDEHVFRTLHGFGSPVLLKHLLVERHVLPGQERYNINIVIETKKQIKNTLVELDSAIIVGHDASEPLAISDGAKSLGAVPRKHMMMDRTFLEVVEKEFKEIERLAIGSNDNGYPIRVVYNGAAKSTQFQCQMEFGQLLRVTSSQSDDLLELKIERLYQLKSARKPLFGRNAK